MSNTCSANVRSHGKKAAPLKIPKIKSPKIIAISQITITIKLRMLSIFPTLSQMKRSRIKKTPATSSIMP